MCGAVLPESKDSVVECEYCGTRQTLPRMAGEKCKELFERANSYRQQKDFDSAVSVYNDIVGEFPNEPEAYWGLCLCKYGIEYVVDPKSGRRIPTCHRTQFKSIFDSNDYKLAIEKADAEARVVYENEAKAIDSIQKGILEISSKEEPFDVFICYKETDDMGRRTQDSVIAQKIYDELTRDGLRVFFARITLEDKLGEKYEPYIFAALNSSKVMLVVGTKPEHFNAVWVKNEWSRYLELAANDSKKKIYPCYYEMSPYALPNEFRGLQSQDCDKLGFEQDLLRGIRKLIPKKTEGKPMAQEFAYTAQPANAAENEKRTMCRRIMMLIEAGDWKQANEKCEGMLDKYPEDEAFYFYKVIVGEHLGLDIKYYAEKLSKAGTISDAEKQYLDELGYKEYLQTAGKYGIVNSIEYIISTYPAVLNEQFKIDHEGGATSTVRILGYAVWNNWQLNVIKMILDRGENANPNSIRTYQSKNVTNEYSALSDAIWCVKDLGIVKILLEAGADPDRVETIHCDDGSIERKSMLAYAVANAKNAEMVKLLLKHGTNPDSIRTYQSKNGTDDYSALSDAIWHAKDLGIVQILLEAGADPDRVETIHFDNGSIGRKSMLTYAIIDAKNAEMVKLLLKHGANPDSIRVSQVKNGTNEYSALSDAIWCAKDLGIVKILLEAGADPDRVETIHCDDGSIERKSMLAYAVANAKNAEMVKLLLKHGTNPDSIRTYQSKNGTDDYSALSDAIWHAKDLGIVQILLEAGADPDRVETIHFDSGSIGRKSMLTYAIADAKNAEMVRLLIKYGATWENKITCSGITKIERRFPYAKINGVNQQMIDVLKACGWKGPLFG